LAAGGRGGTGTGAGGTLGEIAGALEDGAGITGACYAAPRSSAQSEEAAMSTKVEVLKELVELINQRR
jgi:hypothetical protein